MQPNHPPSPQRIDRQATVAQGLAGERVDRVAAAVFPEFSRSLLSRWILQGDLTVDGERVKPKAKLSGGEVLRLAAELELREDWEAADEVPFEVLHQDDALLVLNKPPGVVVHPGAGNPRGTLVNGLLARFPELARLPRAGIVHRLDKDTSGLLLVARTVQAQHALTRMLARREISRRYRAVVEGVLTGGREIDAPIGRDPLRRTRQAVRDDGKPAVTRVRLLERFRAHSLIEAELLTGRTHQIRVHLASIGHPLVGDGRYGARARLPRGAADGVVEVLRGFRRQALHAWKLALAHPQSVNPRADVRVTAAPPEDFAVLVAALEKDAADHAR